MQHVEEEALWENPIIELEEPFTDERGIIQHLLSLDGPRIQSVVWIESRKGSVRANHYHQKDWHYCYIISGSLHYYSRKANDKDIPRKMLVKHGQIVYTPPMVEHAMEFLEDTVFLTLAGGTRTQKDYEDDLVRVQLVLARS